MRQTQKSLPELSERLFSRVGVAGFEPTTPCSQSRCANRTALHPVVPDLDPVIGLVQPREAVVCQSRAFRPGEPSGFRVAKITAFFRSGKLLPRNPPFPAACRIPVGRGCLFACRTVFLPPCFPETGGFPGYDFAAIRMRCLSAGALWPPYLPGCGPASGHSGRRCYFVAVISSNRCPKSSPGAGLYTANPSACAASTFFCPSSMKSVCAGTMPLSAITSVSPSP